MDELIKSDLRGRRSGRLAAEAVKIWADGGMSSRTAAIHVTYPVPPFGSGILYFEPAELTAMVHQRAIHHSGRYRGRANGDVLDHEVGDELQSSPPA